MEKTGVLVNLPEGKSYYAQAVSVLIENDDRVFRIERGTVVKYAISDDDASGLDVGSTVVLFVSVYDNFAKVIKHDGSNQI